VCFALIRCCNLVSSSSKIAASQGFFHCEARSSALSPSQRDSSRGKISLLRALLLGDPRNSLSRQVSIWVPVLSVQRWAYRFPLAYGLSCELRNSVRHISDLHERGAADSGLRLENVAQGCRAGSDEYRARIEGIQNLQKRHPWASLFDELLFLEGLTAGLEFHGRNCISRSQETPSSTSDRPVILTASPGNRKWKDGEEALRRARQSVASVVGGDGKRRN
jgi:hypothetical protein